MKIIGQPMFDHCGYERNRMRLLAARETELEKLPRWRRLIKRLWIYIWASHTASSKAGKVPERSPYSL
jgi:hypothetical protein